MPGYVWVIVMVVWFGPILESWRSNATYEGAMPDIMPMFITGFWTAVVWVVVITTLLVRHFV